MNVAAHPPPHYVLWEMHGALVLAPSLRQAPPSTHAEEFLIIPAAGLQYEPGVARQQEEEPCGFTS